MMMVSDDCLVEHKLDDDSGEDDGGGEEINTPPPPPEFASKDPTPVPKAPTPPTAPTTPPPTHTLTRDPYGINKHLKVEVIKVLVEPATSRGTDQVWRYSVAGFEKARIWTYRCLTLLFALPFALLCGIFLAIFACLHVWFVVPFIQLSNTFLPCLQSLCVCAVDVFISPFCTCFALCCHQMVLLLSNKDRYERRDIETMRM